LAFDPDKFTTTLKSSCPTSWKREMPQFTIGHEAKPMVPNVSPAYKPAPLSKLHRAPAPAPAPAPALALALALAQATTFSHVAQLTVTPKYETAIGAHSLLSFGKCFFIVFCFFFESK
jgi:hypothetical protein